MANEILSNITAENAIKIILLLLGVIEIAPIKVSPLQWIGRRLNKETLDAVKKIRDDLNQHVAQSYRTKIFNFSDDVMAGKYKTKEQWKEVINAIYAYEKYCNENNVQNGLCKQASDMLLEKYRDKLQHNDF